MRNNIRLDSPGWLDFCEGRTEVSLIFLCCLVMVSAVSSFGLMLWFVVLGIVCFVMPGMKGG